MDQELIQKFVTEIGSLRVELLHREVVIAKLQAEIEELKSQQQQVTEEE